MAPKGALDQSGHALSRIIHAFAEAKEDAKIFMAKWNIKDGFWRMDCKAGEEYNFAYVLPQEDGKPVTLVVPASLQMGWVESPPYFCAATKTARDIASTYCDTKVGSLARHKFVQHVTGDADFKALPITSMGTASNNLYYALEVYMDNFMSIVIPTSQDQLQHIATAVMTGIHNVFPTNVVNADNPIAKKSCKKGRDNTPCSKHSWASTLMGGVKLCGWRRRSMQNSSQSYTVGSGRETSTMAYHLGNFNRWWQSYDTRSLPFLGVGDSCHCVTASSSYALQWSISIEMNLYGQHSQTAGRSYENPPVARHAAANLLRDGPTLLG